MSRIITGIVFLVIGVLLLACVPPLLLYVIAYGVPQATVVAAPFAVAGCVATIAGVSTLRRRSRF